MPFINPEIQKELTRLGGTVESGAYAGKPKIKIVHGTEEMQFDWGKMRPRFRRLQRGQYIWKRWFVAPSLHQKLGEWIKRELPMHPNPAVPLRVARFFETANSLEFVELSESDNPAATTIAPSDWQYIADLNEFREEVYPYWFVVQYVAADQLNDTESSWNAQRFDEVYCPEVMNKVLLDCLGPFPKDGLYFIQLLALYTTDEDGNETEIEPTFETVVEPIKEMLRDRDRQTIRARENDTRQADFFKMHEQAKKRADEEHWRKYDEAAKAIRPAFADASAWTTVAAPKAENLEENLKRAKLKGE